MKVLLVNLLAVLNFANVFKHQKRLKNKKNVKKRFLHLWTEQWALVLRLE